MTHAAEPKRDAQALLTDPAEMLQIVDGLARAKSRQDIEAALAIYHPHGVLEAPPLGSRKEGVAEIRAGLRRFFSLFPDYSVRLDGHAVSGATLVAWGTIAMTLSGRPEGQVPNGRRAVLPVFILFRFRDGCVIWESFNFDLASLCRQSGVSLDAFPLASA